MNVKVKRHQGSWTRYVDTREIAGSCGPSTSTDLSCTLDTTGTYIIIVEDSTGKNTGGYTIKVTEP